MPKKYHIILPATLIAFASLFNTKVISADNTDPETIKQLLEMDLEDLMKVRVVTIATGTKQTVSKAPATTNVITAQDIEAMGARDLDEVLETVPGLHVARRGEGYRPIYTIRGIYSGANPEVLMLINGIPITALHSGDRSHAWGGMPINAISRIEVIRGPGSAVYGADAFAGVINIVTKTKEDINGTEVGTRAGSFKTYEGWALHGSRWKGFDIAASLEYRTTDGPKNIVEADAQTQLDQSSQKHVSLAPGAVNTGGDSIDAHLDVKQGLWQARAGYQGRRNLGTGIGAAQALDSIGYLDGDRTNADVTYHNPELIAHWDVTTQLSYYNVGFDGHYRLFPPGAANGTFPDGLISNPTVAERHLRLDTFAFYSGFQQHLIRIGTGYHHNNQYKVTDSRNVTLGSAAGPGPTGGPTDNQGPPAMASFALGGVVDVTDTAYAFNRKQQRNNWYLSLQDVWTLTDEWELTAGIRYDNYSDYGSTVNPRLAFVWQPYSVFTTKLMYGRAFRAPSFTELYNANDPDALGNPNLKPEVINTGELAFDYRATENLHLATNLFLYGIEDKILFSPDTTGKSKTARNVGSWKGRGLELEARWKMNTWSSWQANYSYVKVTDQDNSNDIGNYPHHSAYVRTDWLLIPNWSVNVQAKWTADRQRTVGDPRPELADYTTVDLTLRYKNSHNGHATVALSIRNLFNVDAREPSLGPDSTGTINIPNDLPLAKRNAFVEWRYRF